MPYFSSLATVRTALTSLPAPDQAAAIAVDTRQAQLTKPPGSLGRLERLVAWLAAWQGHAPCLDRVDVLIFAGNHGVTAQAVSAFPASVTAQMVKNFHTGGAAINQLASTVGARLHVLPLALDHPTGDITQHDAMDEAEFLDALNAGALAVADDADLVCLGEMGIGNTTIAAALATALFGGEGMNWVGRGTGIDDAGLNRKARVVDTALVRHVDALADPLAIARRLGGREMAAILGATLAARLKRIPVLLDGFVCTAAAAPLAKLAAGGLAHAGIAHLSEEAGHKRLAEALGQRPLLDLGMRLGEGSGAALAVSILRGALACHNGMATFADAAIDNKLPD